MRGALRILERDAVLVRRLWHGYVFSAFAQPLLYLLAMGVGVGGYVDGGQDLGGLGYLQFVAPGLMAAAAFQLAVTDSLWPVMGGTRWDRRYHTMVAAPLDAREVFAHHLLWNGLRASASGVAFLVVAAPLGALHSPWAVLALPAVVLLVVAVASLAAAFAATTEDDNDFQVVMRFGVLPLFLFSGTFFPTTGLPGWLRAVVPVSPLYHGVELARAATSGHARSAGAVLAHVAVLGALAAAGWALGLRAFRRRLAT